MYHVHVFALVVHLACSQILETNYSLLVDGGWGNPNFFLLPSSFSSLSTCFTLFPQQVRQVLSPSSSQLTQKNGGSTRMAGIFFFFFFNPQLYSQLHPRLARGRHSANICPVDECFVSLSRDWSLPVLFVTYSVPSVTPHVCKPASLR